MVPARPRGLASAEVPRKVSSALAIVAALTAALSFVFWRVFHRDVPEVIGNMRGTALTMLLLGVPLLTLSMTLTARGSLRALFVWLGCLAYFAYNSLMFCFATHFNSYFLLFISLLALSFWSLTTLLSKLDLTEILAASGRVPTRTTAVYLLFSAAAFAWLWLLQIVPATLANEMPKTLSKAGLNQNPVWVLDFAFTFPLTVLGSIWLWKRRAWGYVLGGMMVTSLTLETAGVAVDQIFGHLHDPAAPLSAVPVLLAFTAAGLLFSALFLRGVEIPKQDPARHGLFAPRASQSAGSLGP